MQGHLFEMQLDHCLKNLESVCHKEVLVTQAIKSFQLLHNNRPVANSRPDQICQKTSISVALRSAI